MHLLESDKEYSKAFHNTPTVLERRVGICPVRLGRSIAKPNYRLGPRLISNYSLHFVWKGLGDFEQDNRCFRLKAGDVFCLFPRTTHSFNTDPDHLLHTIWIEMEGKQVPSLLNRIGIYKTSPHISDLVNDKVMQILDDLLEQNQHHFSERADLWNLSTILRLFQSMAPADPAVSGNADGDTDCWVQKGREYFEHHFRKGITVGQAAQFAGVNRTHFSKKFMEVYGIRPVNFLQSLIMREALRLTKETDIPLSEIAVSVGFPDLYTFSKAFKRYYGASPNTFRKKALHETS